MADPITKISQILTHFWKAYHVVIMCAGMLVKRTKHELPHLPSNYRHIRRHKPFL